MCKKNLNWFNQAIWPKTSIERDLKKTWKVEKKGVLILYRCATRPRPVLSPALIKSYVASYNVNDP